MLGLVHAACGTRSWSRAVDSPVEADPIRDLGAAVGEAVTFASPSAEALLRHNGLHTTDGIFALRSSGTLRHRRRTVADVRVVEAGGGISRVFLKLDWGRRIWPRMTDIKTGQVLQSLPEREWNGLRRLRELGLLVPESLALYRPGLFSTRAAIAVREVPAPQSVDDLLRSGDWWASSRADRRLLLDEIVATVDRIHAARLGWRGTSTRHFFPQSDGREGWNLWVIDCEGIHGRANRKTFERDFRKLRRSFLESGADAETLHWLVRRIEAVLATGGTRRRSRSRPHTSFA